MKDFELIPLGDRVVVQAVDAKEEISEGGIVIPEAAQEKTATTRAVVIAVGTGQRLDCGDLLEPVVKVGDLVYLQQYGVCHIEIGGEKLMVLKEEDLTAVARLKEPDVCQTGPCGIYAGEDTAPSPHPDEPPFNTTGG